MRCHSPATVRRPSARITTEMRLVAAFPDIVTQGSKYQSRIPEADSSLQSQRVGVQKVDSMRSVQGRGSGCECQAPCCSSAHCAPRTSGTARGVSRPARPGVSPTDRHHLETCRALPSPQARDGIYDSTIKCVCRTPGISSSVWLSICVGEVAWPDLLFAMTCRRSVFSSLFPPLMLSVPWNSQLITSAHPRDADSTQIWRALVARRSVDGIGC